MMRALCLLSVTFLLSCATGALAWGKKDEDKEPQLPKGKAAADLGLKGLADLASNPHALKDLLASAQDPDIQAEVKKMMADKKFQKEMEKFRKDAKLDEVMKQAGELMKDPKAMEEMAGQYAKLLGEQAPARGIKRSNAGLGLDSLKQAANNPAAMEQAMAMMTDPKARLQVESMMRDPKFQKDMQLMMDTPEFAAAMQASTKQMEAMMKDPKKRKEIEQQAKEAAKWIKA